MIAILEFVSKPVFGRTLLLFCGLFSFGFCLGKLLGVSVFGFSGVDIPGVFGISGVFGIFNSGFSKTGGSIGLAPPLYSGFSNTGGSISLY